VQLDSNISYSGFEECVIKKAFEGELSRSKDRAH